MEVSSFDDFLTRNQWRIESRPDGKKERMMPGPVSDSYDPEWGTRAAAEPIIDSLDEMYGKVSEILGNTQPINSKDLAAQKAELDTPIPATFTE